MRKDDLRGLASEIGYSREDAWKHAVLIRGNNLASFGAKLTMTGAVAPLFLCSRGPALHAAEKYVRDFGIPEDEDGIPYFVKINSTLIRNPSQAYKKRGKYSWDTLMCPYGLFVLQSGSELICEICRGYTVGWTNYFSSGAVERTSYVLTGGEKCTYQFHEGKEQLGVDYHIAKTISAEQVMKHLIKNQELLPKLMHEIAGLASLVGGKEYLDEEEQCKAFIDYAVGAANDVLGTLTSAIIVNASAIIGKELVGRYCREVGASVMEIALSGMPPLYIGWDERDMGTLEKLLAVYSASLDLPATFQKDCFTIHRCLMAENMLHMAKKRDKYHFLIGPEAVEEHFKASSCAMCQSQIGTLGSKHGYAVEKISDIFDGKECRFVFRKE